MISHNLLCKSSVYCLPSRCIVIGILPIGDMLFPFTVLGTIVDSNKLCGWWSKYFRISFSAAVISAPESGNTVMFFLPVDDVICISIVGAGFLLVWLIAYMRTCSWLFCCGSTWVALADACAGPCCVALLRHTLAKWPFFDNIHMCGHMLGIVDVPLYAMLPHNLNKLLVQLLPLFCLAGLSAEQPLLLSHIQTVLLYRLPASTFGYGAVQCEIIFF